MSDTRTREMERNAVLGGPEDRERLARERRRETPDLCPLQLLREGRPPQEVRDLLGLKRLPAGAREAAKVGARANRARTIHEARTVGLDVRTVAQAREAVADILRTANGSRRTRTVSLDALLGDIADAAEGPEFQPQERGETVANSYGYPASTTATVAVRIGQRVVVWVDVMPASKGSSQLPWRLGGDDTARMCAAVHHTTWPQVVMSLTMARRLRGGR